jgi:hypothetical protein
MGVRDDVMVKVAGSIPDGVILVALWPWGWLSL